MKELGERIKRAREVRGMTQQELAYHSSLSLSGLSKIETGRQLPRLDTLAAIATALGVSVVDLLDAAASLLPAAA